jgi:hypothetical protein
VLISKLSLEELLGEAASHIEALILTILLDDLGHNATKPGGGEEG